MNTQSITTLIQVAQLAQQRGILTLEEASIVYVAVVDATKEVEKRQKQEQKKVDTTTQKESR